MTLYVRVGVTPFGLRLSSRHFVPLFELRGFSRSLIAVKMMPVNYRLCTCIACVCSTLAIVHFISPKAAGIKAGDKLQQVGEVHLGSCENGIELLKQQRGPVFITVLRQKF